MLDPNQHFDRRWYLSPGPPAGDEPIHTVEVQDLTEYDYSEVAAAILAVPGTRCVHAPNPKWDQWRARWESEGRFIEVDMMPDEEHLVSADDPGRYIWSGGGLACDCTVGDLAGFLREVRRKCPGVWLCDGGDHNEPGGSRLHTPESFLRMPSLRTD
jgi:hypothetical protein